ncbi:hypothetical protein, partial [Streptomyces sp.]|uniref:hypothetical protein n=1 Tax=Streptomyces sp. TaxID=1931 RepID=UPI002D77C3BB
MTGQPRTSMYTRPAAARAAANATVPRHSEEGSNPTGTAQAARTAHSRTPPRASPQAPRSHSRVNVPAGQHFDH